MLEICKLILCSVDDLRRAGMSELPTAAAGVREDYSLTLSKLIIVN